MLRIKIVQAPGRLSVDGIQLDRFEAGAEYLVGNTLGAFLLADGWAVPIDEPPPTEPAPRADGGGRSPRPGRGAPNHGRKKLGPNL